MIVLGILMDPIESIHYKKDSTLAMLWEAERRGWVIHFFQQKDLFFENENVYAQTTLLKVKKNPDQWYEWGSKQTIPVSDLNVILMRKDPPFDMEYIYTTYLLEQAERKGVFVVNKPQGLRDCNEKLLTLEFLTCCPPTLVTQSIEKFRDFHQQYKDIIAKPLDAMGGASVFRIPPSEQNASVIFEVLTHKGTRYAMAQKYIPEISDGDKRIILINGKPIPFALARVPAKGEVRGNLAAGAKGVVQPLTERDQWICQQIGPVLREKGLYFVGIDVIGDYLTEINVTSPTGIREIDDQEGTDIAGVLFNFIEKNATN